MSLPPKSVSLSLQTLARIVINSLYSLDSSCLVNKPADELTVMFQKGLIFRLWWHSFCWQTLWGYERDMCRTIFTWIFIILSIGVLRLIFYWKPNWFIEFTHHRVNLSKATHVLLKVGYNGYRLNVMLLICRRQNFVHWYADTQGQIILEFDTHILMQI